VGTTNLVVALLESGWTSPVELRNPVQAIKTISRDAGYRWLIEDNEGHSISAVDVQRCFLRAAQELNVPGNEWIMDEWQATLNALENDPLSLYDRLDWVAKKMLLDDFAESENLDWRRDAATLQSLDLAYHDVDPYASLYYGLVQSEMMQTLVDEGEITLAKQVPPLNTRAALRGFFVRRFAPNIKAISWGAIIAEEDNVRFNIRLPKAGDFPALVESLESVASLSEAARILKNP
jgi:proteasome accessory factor A